MATFILIIFTALAVWLETAGPTLGFFLGAKLELLPLLIVYAALTVGPRSVVALSIVGGLLQDSMSVGPLGLSILPLCGVGLVVHYLQPYLFRDELTQQCLLGAAATLASILTVLLGLAVAGSAPAFSLWLYAKVVLLVTTGALLTPVVFVVLDWLNRLLGALPPRYEAPSPSWSMREPRRYGPPKDSWKQRAYK
jgi:rod shape-determining protein MreD